MSDMQPEGTPPPAPTAEPNVASEPGTTEPQQAVDPLAALSSRVDEIGSGTQSFQDEMRQWMAAQQQEPYDPYEQEPQEPGFDPTDPQQAQQYINEQVQAALYPSQMEQLVGKYPDLRTDSAVQQAVVANLQAAGYDPRGMVPPNVVEMAYKAHKADQIAQQQTPVAENPPPQLDPAGASPQQQETNLADLIMQAAPGVGNFLRPPQ